MAFDELNPYSTSGQIDSDKWINQPNQPISQQQSFDALGFYDQMRSELGIQNTPDLLRGSEYIQQLYDIPSGMDMMNPLGHKSVPTAPSYGGKTYTDPFEFTGLSTEWAMDKFKQDLATLPQTARNDFKYAGPTPWNPTLHEAMRYYSHPSYGSLGYDPFRDNEDYFNKYGSSWGDFARSSSAHLATAMMAFKSQQTASWDMPYLSDPDTAKTFAELTSNYQSTKPGVIPFMGNLINCSLFKLYIFAPSLYRILMCVFQF